MTDLSVAHTQICHTCKSNTQLRVMHQPGANTSAPSILPSLPPWHMRVHLQTAYGIEAEVVGYDEAYDASLMLFMDYRRHHTGLWDGGARLLDRGAAV